jgi:hypothetical protein
MSRLRWVGAAAVVVGLAAWGWFGAGSQEAALVGAEPAPLKPREAPVVGAPAAAGEAAGPRPRDARELAEQLRARGAGGPKVQLPGGLGGSGAAEVAGRTGVDAVNRRAERVARRADLALEDLRALVKDEATLGEVDAILAELDGAFDAAREGLSSGRLDVPGATRAMDEAQRAAAGAASDLLEGEAAALMEGALGPPPPPDDGWGGVPLEEWVP